MTRTMYAFADLIRARGGEHRVDTSRDGYGEVDGGVSLSDDVVNLILVERQERGVGDVHPETTGSGTVISEGSYEEQKAKDWRSYQPPSDQACSELSTSSSRSKREASMWSSYTNGTADTAATEYEASKTDQPTGAPKLRQPPGTSEGSDEMLQAAREIARGGMFPILLLSQHIRKKIYDMMLCPETLRIMDMPPHWGGAKPPAHQLRYTLKVQLSQAPTVWRSTYIAASDGTANMSTGINTAILRASKQIHDEAAQVMYGQRIMVMGSAEGAVSWLHDTSRYLHAVKCLNFIYRNNDKTLMVGGRYGMLVCKETSVSALIHLCDVLVNRCTQLHELSIVIDDKWWTQAQWRRGVNQATDQKPFLRQLGISEIRTPNGTEFVKKLQEAMEAKRNAVSTMAIRTTCNDCRARFYEGCCFVKLPQDEYATMHAGY